MASTSKHLGKFSAEREVSMEPMDQDRVRARAHQIWEEEGRPEGRADAHWAIASEELAIEGHHVPDVMPGKAASENKLLSKRDDQSN